MKYIITEPTLDYRLDQAVVSNYFVYDAHIWFAHTDGMYHSRHCECSTPLERLDITSEDLNIAVKIWRKSYCSHMSVVEFLNVSLNGVDSETK